MPDVSGNPDIPNPLRELMALREEELHEDLVGYVVEGSTFGPMVRHPLVLLPSNLPGLVNRAYRSKREALADAEAEEDYEQIIWLHEKPWRVDALIDYVTGRYEDGRPVTLNQQTPDEVLDLVAAVWADSENIEEMMNEWSALFGTGREIWLGNTEERLAFNALPDPVLAYRAAIDDGGWSWTTKESVAHFFANRFRKPDEPKPEIERAYIPKSWCFGYLTRRGENELLVRLDADTP